jgi:metallo-beta-lactamase family protein
MNRRKIDGKTVAQVVLLDFPSTSCKLRPMTKTTNEFSLTFHGGADEVTGSRHLLNVGPSRVMLDCGMFQGHRHEAIEKNLSFPAAPPSVSAVLLSHAHIDHCGGLPLLVKRGFTGPIHCTTLTADLIKIMLMDSAFIQEEDAKFFNKIHAAEGVKIEPLYSVQDAEHTLKLIEPHPFDTLFEAAPGVHARFLNAGHVLGSALIEVEAQAPKGLRRILFTGDLGRQHPYLVPAPDRPAHVDYLLMESTYGGRQHPTVDEGAKIVRDILQKSYENGGKILIPSFALERTQEILFLLESLRRKAELPPFHIYVDSPMAINITDIFSKALESPLHAKFLNDNVTIHADPFGLENVRLVRSVEESKSLNDKPGRKIIVAASGMCEGGRILHHLRNGIDDDKTTVLLVGYQAGGTLGRRLIDGQKKVKIFGLVHRVVAEIRSVESFSAHADQNDLATFAKRLDPRPRSIFLVHGDTEQRKALKERLIGDGLNHVHLPVFGETVPLE